MTWEKAGNIRGRAGEPGSDGAPGASVIGPAGERGDPGRDGRDGRDGRNVVSGSIENGALLLTLSDGQTLILGRVVGDQGERGQPGIPGVGIDALAVTSAGELVVTLSDERSENLGMIRGPAGMQGVKGDRGQVGPAGPAGESIVGEQGPIGPRGEAGAPGRDGVTAIIELGESRPANMTARDIERLRVRELIIDGASVGHVFALD